MNSAIERLLGLKVKDVMSKQVTTVSAHQTMGEAAGILYKNEITGAPVVDEVRHCVGVGSAADYVRYQARNAQQSDESFAYCGHLLEPGSEQTPLHIDPPCSDLVEHYMSSGVQTISAEASLLGAGREMCAAHIHRLPVVDAHDQIIGLVSSLDLTAALIKVFEE